MSVLLSILMVSIFTLIGRKTLVDSQFEEVVRSKFGYHLKIPASWKCTNLNSEKRGKE